MRTADPAAARARPDRPRPPGSAHPNALLFALSVGALLGGLDSSIVNTVLPVVTQAFGSDVAGAEWIITVYLLVLSGLLLSLGRLGDLRGHRPLYLTGLVIFAAGSALSGLAPSIGFLVGARAFQALGAAMLSANSPAILTAAIRANRRGRAFGLYSMAVYLGLVVGPGLGGFLTDLWGWRAIFYVTVPIALLAFGLSARVLPDTAPASPHERFDWWGAVVFTIGLVALLLGLNQGHAWGWASPAILGCFAVAFGAMAVFVAIERRVPSPMLDLDLFRVRCFAAAIGSAILNYLGAYTVVFLLPFYLLQARDLTPSQTGLVLSAMPVVMVVAAPICGALSDRFGSRLFAAGGMGLLSTGLFLLSRLGLDTPFAAVVGILMLCGLGLGAFSSPNTNAALSSVPAPHRGIASGVLGTARNLGMMLGIGLAGAVLATGLGGTTTGSPAAVVAAVSTGFLLASGLAAAGVVTAAARP
ncbi:MAG TPA: DHA2 family efflux MFS transporter permease subunit [Chloroflexota bacterium]|nr:DHA2 family efflux MFS transporter permease subunit [Chloroflexota bacterium]